MIRVLGFEASQFVFRLQNFAFLALMLHFKFRDLGPVRKLDVLPFLFGGFIGVSDNTRLRFHDFVLSCFSTN